MQKVESSSLFIRFARNPPPVAGFVVPGPARSATPAQCLRRIAATIDRTRNTVPATPAVHTSGATWAT